MIEFYTEKPSNRHELLQIEMTKLLDIIGLYIKSQVLNGKNILLYDSNNDLIDLSEEFKAFISNLIKNKFNKFSYEKEDLQFFHTAFKNQLIFDDTFSQELIIDNVDYNKYFKGLIFELGASFIDDEVGISFKGKIRSNLLNVLGK